MVVQENMLIVAEAAGIEESDRRRREAVARIVARYEAAKKAGRTDRITPSWVLLNEARDERIEQLAGCE